MRFNGYSQLLFFTLAVFFLLLMGDSSYRWIVSLISVIYFFINAPNINFQLVYKYKSLAIAWVLWVISIFLVTLFSSSLPLSIEELPALIVPWIFFWTILLSKHESKDNIFVSMIVLSLVAISVAVSLLHFMTLLFPVLGKSLPGLSVFYSGYGHSHVSAIHVLLFPIVWYFVSDQYKQGNPRWLILPLLLVTSVVLSAGRINILIVLVECFVLFFGFASLKRGAFVVYRNLIFGSLLAGLIVFGMASLFSEFPWCDRAIDNYKFCRTISEDHRPQYWQQAILAIKDQPLYGYGPGTFINISKKYQIFPGTTSTFTHNAILQRLAEDGLVSGLLFMMTSAIVIFWSVRMAILKRLKNSKLDFQQAANIGLLGAVFISFTDFDWQLLGVYAMVMIVSALAIRSNNLSNNIRLKTNSLLSYAFLFVFFALIVSIALGSLLNIYSSYISPLSYFYYSRNNLSITNSDYQKLYRNHPDEIMKQIVLENDFLKKADLQQHLFEIFPWAGLYDRSATTYFYAGDLASAFREESKVLSFVLNVESLHPNYFDNDYKRQLASEMISIISEINKQSISSVSSQEIAVALNKARQLDYWIFDFPSSRNVLIESNSSQYLLEVLPVLLSDSRSLGTNLEMAQLSYISVAQRQALSREQFGVWFDEFLKYWDNHDPGRLVQIITLLDQEFAAMLVETARVKDIDWTMKTAVSWKSMHDSLTKIHPVGHYVESNLISKTLIDVGTMFQTQSGFGSQDFYLLAHEIRPSSFYENQLWISSSVLRNKASTESIIEYADAMLGIIKEANSEVHVPFYVWAAQETDDPFKKIQYLDHVKLLQPSGYWEQVILGNYYLSEGKFDLAKNEYNSCLGVNPSHLECKDGLLEAEKSMAIKDRYDRANSALSFD